MATMDREGASGVSAAGARVRVQLLGEFMLADGATTVPVPPAGQRLLAFLGVREVSGRDTAASLLWIDHTESRAQACLRSTLWRLPKLTGDALVRCDGPRLRLRPDVQVDLSAQRQAAEALSGVSHVPPGARSAMFTTDLLPAWSDDWLVIERERYRQTRLHALERLAIVAAGEGAFAVAIEAGLCAVAAEPLRASAHSCVILAHLREGNRCEATRQARSYVGLLHDAGLPVELPPTIAALLPGPRPPGSSSRPRPPALGARAGRAHSGAGEPLSGRQ